MTADLNRRMAALACERLTELAEDFAEETDHRPTIDELVEILTSGIQSSKEELLADVHPRDVLALTAQLKRGAKGRSDSDPSEVYDCNDNVFVLANALWSDLARAYKGETGERPTLGVASEILVAALHDCGDHVLSDVRGTDLEAIDAKLRTSNRNGGGRRSDGGQVGDVVAIPAPGGDAFHAVILDRNDFGTAFGVFKGTRPADAFDPPNPPPADPHPLYSGDDLVRDGEWPVVASDESLLELFPAEPEVYHEVQLDPSMPDIGPHGAGESPSGAWRDLSEEEAAEIGLIDDSYDQFHLPEDLPAHLAERMT